MTVILDGRRAARERRDRLAVEVRSLRSPRRPTLATLRVDDDPRSDRHIGIKVRAAAEVGIALRRVDLPASTSPPVVEAAVDELVADGGVDGVFVQLPLAPELDAVPVLDRIPAGKDVDGLGSASRSCWEQGEPAFRPCAAEAVVGLLERYGIPVTGVEVVVVGHVAGLELLLGPVIEVGPGSPGLATVTAGAGLLVCAAGRPGLI
ncbi:MAG: bifunctional 5,10-methylene-tetrahydrofolate dehydrogenase/5,10-methylene-tetrahydrofolate cyclohydrolase, partial [Actinomycetota bacterium]|nr:bifunctional 5,10-methylene-tetrahydrofolate dehydrogenase/5,10-methylene-tetrahydrofolate cyclohydrolase [Actinomycetota bacterium]